MTNTITTINEKNEIITIEILIGFKIEEIGKEYVAYTINDDNLSNTVTVLISEIDYDNDIPKIVPIKEDEKEMVLLFYNNLKKSMNI